MLDRHRAHQNRDNAELSPETRKAPASRPMSDREVPLPRATHPSLGDMPATVHQWLDGEMSERTARSADASSVAFWNRIATETTQRSAQLTPPQLSDRIMAALPDKTPAPVQASTGMVVKPLTAIVCAAALLAAGAVVLMK